MKTNNIIKEGEKVCEKNCPDYNGMSILHLEQCGCSCHPVLAKGEITSITQAVAEERERVVGEIEKIYSISDTQQDSCDNFKKKVLDTLSSLELLTSNND